MIQVNVKKQSNYPIKVSVVKKQLKSFLKEKGLVSDFSVNVSFVNEKTMLKLATKFLGEKDTMHSILSFPEAEVKGDFEYPSGTPLPLGEIVICYPELINEAKEEGVLIDSKINELVEHGALHLLGEHHK